MGNFVFDSGFVQYIMYDCLLKTLLVSAPMLLSSMILGLLISIIQAATSIQEQTLTFVPKMIIIFLAMILCGPWIIHVLQEYTVGLFDLMGTIGQNQ